MRVVLRLFASAISVAMACTIHLSASYCRQAPIDKASRFEEYGSIGSLGKHMLGTRPRVVHSGAGEPSVSAVGKLTPDVCLLD